MTHVSFTDFVPTSQAIGASEVVTMAELAERCNVK